MLLPALFIQLSLAYHAFAVTVIPSTLNQPKPYESEAKPICSDYDLLFKLNPRLAPNVTYPFVDGRFDPRLIQNEDLQLEIVDYSTFGWPNALNETTGIYASQDSLVRGAMDAGAKHQHLLVFLGL
ncbi:hypothetical protein EJ08DRAFT_23030 [Tothia fuscella]|uniref:Uncharacterized protein n=1 Tax=Tothia fuscella TaxID=1048955 RepID=A0A9P4NYQ5_9PEZI|nr:hypothetical protein EJ08DRAFT_23030 [Tothia fuscella]